MFLELMNVLFASRDSKIRNGLTLLVVSVVILNINNQIVPQNAVFSLFEMLIIFDYGVIFISNLFNWVEFY